MEKIVSWIKSPFVESAKSYFLKAAFLMLALYLVGNAAPKWSLPLLLIAMVAYAVVSMMGSLHFVVLKRMLRRYKLRDTGGLAKLNRKWTAYVIALFIAAMISAVVFVLESPGWDLKGWGLIILAVVFYYVFFQVALHLSKGQLADGFDRASAMKWAFWATGVLVCILYIVFAGHHEVSNDMTMAQAFESVPTPYVDSPCALFVDLETLTTFLDGLKVYAVHGLTQAYAWVGVIADAVMFAVVFFGMASQFCFCMLSGEEMKAEFQLLPPVDEKKEGGRPLLKRYFVIIAAIAVAFCAVFVVANNHVAVTRDLGERTALSAQVEEWKDSLIRDIDMQNKFDEKAVELSEFEGEMQGRFQSLLDNYYAECISNVEAYIDEHYVSEGSVVDNALDLLSPLFPPKQEEIEEARQEFVERISVNAEYELIEQTYSNDFERYKNLVSEANEYHNKLYGNDFKENKLPEKLDLWQSLDDDAVRNVLLKRNLTREDLRTEIKKLIESAHQDALNVLDALVKDSNQQNE